MKHLLLLTFLSLGFTASCSRVRLQPTAPGNAQLSSSEPFYLPPPEPEKGPQRYVFFIDMSHSAIADACKTDVNNDSEPREPAEGLVKAATNPGLACKSEGGSDPLGWRLNWVKEWLGELSTAQDVKVIIQPYTGGFMELRRINRGRNGGFFGSPDPVQNGEFISVTQALGFVDILKNENDLDRKAARETGNNQYMGTSVPALGLQRVSERLLGDMTDLQKKDQLQTARYEFVILSDGMPTPTMDHFKTALNLGSCPYSCILNRGQTAGCSDKCRLNVQELLEFWGDPTDNRYENIRTRLNAISNLPRILGEGKLQMHFITLNTKNIPARERDKNFNFMMRARDHFINSRHLELTTEQPPFSFQPRSGDSRTLKLTHFFALNSNARVNALGDLQADTDGDGVFDIDEIAQGTDPLKPRSGNGMCLDIMSASSSYKERCNQSASVLDCDMQLDTDGDSLNECEERILGTDAFDFDTDGDGIPDSLELVYNFFPGRNDERSDSNSDNIPNVLNFEKGLNPALYPDRIPGNRQIQLQKEYLGQRELISSSGEVVRTEGYQIRLISMPVLPVSGAGQDMSLYLSKSKSANAKIPAGNLLVSAAGDAKSNTITYLARVTDLNDPSFFRWYLLKTPIALNYNVNLNTIDLSKMKTIPVMDPREQR